MQRRTLLRATPALLAAPAFAQCGFAQDATKIAAAVPDKRL